MVTLCVEYSRLCRGLWLHSGLSIADFAGAMVTLCVELSGFPGAMVTLGV